MELDPTRMCELLVGLPAVRVLGIVDQAGGPLWIHVETTADRPVCSGCGGAVVVKDRPLVELVDLPAFGRPARLVWRKHRWRCPSSGCPVGSWTEEAPSIAAARLVIGPRAGPEQPQLFLGRGPGNAAATQASAGAPCPGGMLWSCDSERGPRAHGPRASRARRRATGPNCPRARAP